MHINLWKATLGCKQMEMHFEIVELMIKKKKEELLKFAHCLASCAGYHFPRSITNPFLFF